MALEVAPPYRLVFFFFFFGGGGGPQLPSLILSGLRSRVAIKVALGLLERLVGPAWLHVGGGGGAKETNTYTSALIHLTICFPC